MEHCSKIMDAEDFLDAAQDALDNRAASRDAPNGERSMARAVAAYNSIYGCQMTETQGWQFMVLLKMSRGSQGAYRADDYIDQVGYSALAGESEERNK